MSFRKQGSLFVPTRNILIPHNWTLRDNRGFISPGVIGGIAGARRRTAAAYTAYATLLDDTPTYMTHSGDFTGNARGQKGILSFWYKSVSNGNAERILQNASFRILIYKNTSGHLQWTMSDYFAPTTRWAGTSSGGAAVKIEGGSWHHICMVWDLTSNDATQCKCFIDGSDQTSNITAPTGSLNLDYTSGTWKISDSTANMNASLCEFYFNTAATIAPASVVGYFASGGRPISLGADGSTPTGSQPILYLKDSYSTFYTNSGSGGDFVVSSGTLQTSTPP